MKRTALSSWPSAMVLFLCLSIFYSCNFSKETSLRELVISRPALTEETFFDFRTIQRVRRATEANEINNSKVLLREAIEYYKAGGGIEETIQKIKTSTKTFPSSKAYVELGNLYLEQKKYTEAENALTIAELLNHPKLSRVYFKLSKLHAAQKNIDKGNMYLKLALEKGFKDYTKIVNDQDFENLKDSEEYRALIADIIPNESGRKEALFDVFISSFPKLKLPYRIHRDETEEFNYENYIPYDFEELLVDKIREKENKEYSFVGMVDSTARYIAVLYTSIDAIDENYSPATETYLVVYDKKGNIIDNLLFSCFCSPTLTYSGSIDRRKEIRITEFETTWKHDPTMTDFLDNEIVSTRNKSVSYYKLSPEGKIKFEKKVETTMLARI